MDKLFRRGIVAVLRNAEGLVLFCERSDHPGSWQFPQGGLEGTESPQDAFLRELREELGNGNCRVLKVSPELVRYEWPYPGKDGMLGQAQSWILGEFLEGALPQLEKSDQCFRAWRWLSVEEALELVVDWKRPAYKNGLGQLCLLPK